MHKVVHCKKDPYDTYIGRPLKWGNPFSIGKDGTREEVIKKYRDWLFKNDELLSFIHELKGKSLDCWCAPQACHGDTLLDLANTISNLPCDYTKLDWLQKKAVRLEYIRIQKGFCMHCNSRLDEEPPEYIRIIQIDWDLFPKGFLNYPIHLQHCHKTNLTEGAVHAYCNAVLWQHYGR